MALPLAAAVLFALLVYALWDGRPIHIGIRVGRRKPREGPSRRNGFK
jgi:hypothetical protein